MLAVVLIIVFKPRISMQDLSERLTGKYLWVGVLVFFFIGIYGGFINAGIGFVILLFLHYFNHMSLVRANATKVAVVFIYTLSALAVFIYNDKVIWKIGLILAIGNGAGAWFSSSVSYVRLVRFSAAFSTSIISVMFSETFISTHVSTHSSEK